MTQRREHPGRLAADYARAELYDTLGQLREQLDYAQRIDDALDRSCRRVGRVRRENPLGFAAGVAATAATAGLAVWAVTRAVIRTFE